MCKNCRQDAGATIQHTPRSTDCTITALSCEKFRSEMFTERAEVRQNEEAAGPAAHFFVFERPRSMVRNEHGVQPRLERGIDIAPRTVADHPSVRFHDAVPG